MFKYFGKFIRLLALVIVGSSGLAITAKADMYNVAFRGEVTQVADDINWFNDSIQTGMTVEGTYSFFDEGFQSGILFGDPTVALYQYFLEPNSLGFPVLPAKMQMTIGGVEYTTDAHFNPVPYQINVGNDGDGSGFFSSAGDNYSFQSPLPFPAHFTDWTGDPTNDPDGFFFPGVSMGLRLSDPTGTAFGSTGLPLILPGLNQFESAIGNITIFDGNGEPDYAGASFRITSLQSVPEPSSFLITAAGLLVIAIVRRRKPFSNR